MRHMNILERNMKSIKSTEPNKALEPMRLLVTESAFPHFVRALSAPSNRMAQFER